jgi:hypothetical protein
MGNMMMMMMYLLFELARLFWSWLFFLTVHLESALFTTTHLQAMLNSFIGAVDEVSRVCAACS